MQDGRSEHATLVAALRRHATLQPRASMCRFQDEDGVQEITYASLFEHAAAYAQAFRNEGLGPGDVVFIILTHRPDLLYAFVGAILADCIPSFLAPPSEKQDPTIYRETQSRLFEHTAARLAVVDAETWTDVNAAAFGGAMRFMLTTDATAPLQSIVWPDPAPDDLALLQFSSGTTGLRKGAMLTHGLLIKQINGYARTIALEPATDHIVSWLPLYHDMGLIACLITPLVTGTPLTLISPLDWVGDPRLLFDAIARDGGTLVWLPNFAFNHLARTVRASRAGDLSRVRAFINCSEPCKAESFEMFVRTFAPAGIRMEQMQTCYAMAEAVFAVTQSALGEAPRTLRVGAQALAEGKVVADAGGLLLVSCGRALPGFAIRLLGTDTSDVETGRVGEIAIRGPSVFAGYYRAPEASAEAFHDGWYRTGDLGFLHEDQLYVTGRIKDIIIIYGRNYYSHDIEAVASAVPDVKPGRTVACGVFSETAGSEEVILIAETESTDLEARKRIAAEVKSRVLETLSLSLAKVVLVEPKWLVKTSSGKISRHANLSKYITSSIG